MNIMVSLISLSLLNGLGGMTVFAKGPGESTKNGSTESTKVNIVTYYQNIVRTLGNWEQQPDGYWKFKQTVGGQYLTNSWIESLSEVGSFYYVNDQGVMVTSCTTPDGYNVDASGLWKNTAAPSVPNTGTTTNKPSSDAIPGYVDANDYYNSIADRMGQDPNRQKELEDKTIGVDNWGSLK